MRYDPEERFLFLIARLFQVPVDTAYSWPLVRAWMSLLAKASGSSVNRPR